ncbi:class A beta-lactamase-related serine hydrolase [Luteimonas sp. BDR2-5]|uniref:serine hydrolase n=1 Tax=Proluteimonas luteida TaxID=2878685 RepID=UPI001E2FA287|nr:serine hydrolase [Luteimonas sp. BDR2-5]MCD9027391.1 class A beta-lactamase-related serine hydrolase [Luteimonas sp. BDR2-5]
MLSTAVIAAALLSPLAAARTALALPPLPGAEPTPAPVWAAELRRRLDAADARFPGELGVYVHDIDTGASYAYRADEPWYLASGVKVPVAIAVLREIDNGWLSLDSHATLLPSDFVDGGGHTNSHPPGTRLRISYLLEQMIIHSDNTATDVLIRTVGLGQVNAVAAELIAAQGVRITSLADVRRLAYGQLHTGAAGLTSQDLLALQRSGVGDARARKLAQLLAVSPADFLLPGIDDAFEAYYATHVNTASLVDYGRMLTSLSAGLALEPDSTRYLLDLMSRVETGKRRIRAGLPARAGFAHKTGTQYRRLCDLGIVTMPARATSQPQARVVVAACARGAGTAASERALRDVGAAVTAAGVLDRSPSPSSSP